MPVTFELRENGYVLYVRATDPLPVHEFKAAFIPQQQYLDQASHKLHVLVDITHHKSPPPSAIASARHRFGGILTVEKSSSSVQVR